MELWLSAFEWAQAIAVREGASGVSRDAPRFGLKYHLVSNGERKNVEYLKKSKEMYNFTQFFEWNNVL